MLLQQQVYSTQEPEKMDIPHNTEAVPPSTCRAGKGTPLATPPLLLAIESSCDDSAAALLRGDQLISEAVSSQVIHTPYAGVVPELAAREHLRTLLPVVDQACRQAGISVRQLTHIAYTHGPGLAGSLLVGSTFAQALATALHLPCIPVHHILAHLMAGFLTPAPPQLPFLGLVVSGGHTLLCWVESVDQVSVLGQTLDDAAGEAFDKIAKLIGFPYPGGRHIDQAAREGAHKFTFPVTNLPGYNFSFSGIKTAVRYFLEEKTRSEPGFLQEETSHLCASLQHAIVEMIILKVEAALRATGAKQLVAGGGVVANSYLRERLQQTATRHDASLCMPSLAHCQDNAAMVGITAYHMLQAGWEPARYTLPDPRLPLQTLPA